MAKRLLPLAPTPLYFVHVRPSFARTCKIHARPQNLRNELARLNDIDQFTVLQKQREEIAKWCDKAYTDVIYDLKPEIVDTLDYLRIMYGDLKKPLRPATKLLIRNNIMRVLEKENLNDGETELFISVLRSFGCLESAS